ncbi:MAG: flagellar hook-basal body complex protein [Vampirovibrionales bacterium]|nr:flagellar hook-basal body complex protein [Vampirovibrionales bacterium]
MTQGLYSAVSGIRANQTRMNVISNNIANVNTISFKSSSANFATVFAQTINGGTSPNGLRGGTNPSQIGNGTLVAEITSNFSQGGAQFTGKSTDLMIQGDGFFAVERVDTNNGNNSTDFYLSRAGNFSLDSSGNLVTSSGNRVRGTSQLVGSSVSTLGRVQIPLSFVVVKDVDANNNVLETHFAQTGTPTANIAALKNAGAVAGAYPAGQIVAPVELRSFSIGTDGSITATYSNGDRISVRTEPLSVSATDPTQSRREIVHQTYEGRTFTAEYAAGAANQVGVNGEVDQVPGYEVFTGGTTPASANAMQGMQLQLQSATVTNNQGLLYDGSNNFLTGANSGQTSFGIAGNGSKGTIQAGSLESSNVDVAGEFTNMIVTQRGIEAASRVLQAQSQILQTIIQNTV